MSCSTCFIKEPDTSASGFDWINDLPDTSDMFDLVEVKFKSTRKEFYRNHQGIILKRGDKVVVSASPGYDVGEVMLTGYLADKQFRRKVSHPERYKTGTIYRKATSIDLKNLEKARSREQELLILSRRIAAGLGLEMKIGDIEVRADSGKAIFYYIADGRVDFRQLIKDYAREFNLKIEMKQIGARQEAGLIGGIGSCGRELCCSSWRTDFSSVSSSALDFQGLSQSAQKMAGQCGKLKCCLLYELDAYVEAGQEFPRELLVLETARGTAKPIKTDFLNRKIWYTLQGSSSEKTFQLSLEEVKNYIQDNKKGIKPDPEGLKDKNTGESQFISGEAGLTRKKKRVKPFDKKKRAASLPQRQEG